MIDEFSIPWNNLSLRIIASYKYLVGLNDSNYYVIVKQLHKTGAVVALFTNIENNKIIKQKFLNSKELQLYKSKCNLL